MYSGLPISLQGFCPLWPPVPSWQNSELDMSLLLASINCWTFHKHLLNDVILGCVGLISIICSQNTWKMMTLVVSDHYLDGLSHLDEEYLDLIQRYLLYILIWCVLRNDFIWSHIGPILGLWSIIIRITSFTLNMVYILTGQSSRNDSILVHKWLKMSVIGGFRPLA